MTRCAQVCFTGTEDDQAERHDQGTIDDTLGNQDTEEGGDALEEADREADPVTQSQRKNVLHPGFVFLAELASQSDGYIEICVTY